MSVKSKAEQAIDAVLSGSTCSSTLRTLIDGKTVHGCVQKQSNRITGEVYVKTFFDSYGTLQFCSENNVLFNTNENAAMYTLIELSERMHTDDSVLDIFDGYEGTLDDLYNMIVKE